MKNDAEHYNSLFLHMAFMKWRFIVTIFKYKHRNTQAPNANGTYDNPDDGELAQDADHVIRRVMETQVKSYTLKIEVL